MNEENTGSDFIAPVDMTDEMRIQFTIDKFYEKMENLNQNKPEHIRQIKILRNNLVNMTDTYIKKFKNKLILDEFYKKLKTAKEKAVRDGYINKYVWYMNEIRVIQEMKGIQEDISEKLAEQFIQNMLEEEKEKCPTE